MTSTNVGVFYLPIDKGVIILKERRGRKIYRFYDIILVDEIII